jgi:hypothetical protein
MTMSTVSPGARERDPGMSAFTPTIPGTIEMP